MDDVGFHGAQRTCVRKLPLFGPKCSLISALLVQWLKSEETVTSDSGTHTPIGAGPEVLKFVLMGSFLAGVVAIFVKLVQDVTI